MALGNPNAGGAFLPASPRLVSPPVTIVPGNGPLNIYAGILRMMKATAAAAILPNPAANDEGLVLMVVNGTAAAHIITGSYQDGVTGGTKTTATMGAFIGASMTLVAINRTWTVLALNVCPIT